jgi:trimeric autotransporter adhesin
MQTWAKRGLQTALVTGGLLMLGTGIASANENVNPDRPASPIDGGAGIGLHMDNNVVGTPVGQVRAPAVDRTVGTDGVTGAVPAPLPGANRGRADIVVPVDISGNAVAAGGDARVANESTQTVDQPDPVAAGRGPGSAADNVVAVNHAAPVQVTGNAVSLAGNATSVNDATQSATTGGDISTDGTGRTLAGNVVAEQGATPVQVDGNAIAGGGQARTYSTTVSDARSDGSLGTSGDGGTAAGNVGGAPLAVPVEVTHQAVSGLGNADAAGQNTVTTQSGDSNLSTANGASYVRTDGDPSTLSGNVASPGAADPVALACNAISAVGNTDAQCATTNTNAAGGPVNTAGCGSTGSGNTAVVPVAEPSEVFGNGAAAIGNASAGASNTDTSNALGNSYDRGDGAALSSNGVAAPVAGANDVFANGVSAIGNATGTAGNDVTSGSGGYTGTTGTSSTGSGNIGQLPVAAPVETYGLAGSAGGTATGTVPAETKSIRAGGSPNANDDNGTASSNVVSAPTAVPAQVFGDAAGLVANTGADADNASTVTAGGNPSATGAAGTGSGNIVQLATATPAQLFDDGASVVGNGAARGENDTTTRAGGKATSNGRGGTVTGDIVNVPDAGPIQAFGVAAASPGNEEADALNNTTTTAGADTATNGDHGALAGDVVTAQVTQVEQVLGSGLAGGGNSAANGVNNTAARSGGDVTTSGDWGALSGDLADVPATDLTQAVTDGVAALGNQRAFGVNRTSAVSGGAATTSGGGFLDGTGVVQPAGAAVTVFRVPVDVLGRLQQRVGRRRRYGPPGRRAFRRRAGAAAVRPGRLGRRPAARRPGTGAGQPARGQPVPRAEPARCHARCAAERAGPDPAVPRDRRPVRPCGDSATAGLQRPVRSVGIGRESATAGPVGAGRDSATAGRRRAVRPDAEPHPATAGDRRPGLPGRADPATADHRQRPDAADRPARHPAGHPARHPGHAGVRRVPADDRRTPDDRCTAAPHAGGSRSTRSAGDLGAEVARAGHRAGVGQRAHGDQAAGAQPVRPAGPAAGADPAGHAAAAGPPQHAGSAHARTVHAVAAHLRTVDAGTARAGQPVAARIPGTDPDRPVHAIGADRTEGALGAQDAHRADAARAAPAHPAEHARTPGADPAGSAVPVHPHDPGGPEPARRARVGPGAAVRRGPTVGAGTARPRGAADPGHAGRIGTTAHGTAEESDQ